MSRFKEGDVVDIWWPSNDGSGYKTGTIVEILDDVNAMVKFDGGTPVKCYVVHAIPHMKFMVIGEGSCNDTK